MIYYEHLQCGMKTAFNKKLHNYNEFSSRKLKRENLAEVANQFKTCDFSHAYNEVAITTRRDSDD